MQQVNLYQPVLRKEKRAFSALAILQVALLISLALGVIYSLDVRQIRILKGELAKHKNQETERLARLEMLTKQFPPRRKSRQLERKIERLETQKKQKTRVIDLFADQKQGNTSGFSVYLAGLARQRIPDLWLEGFRIRGGGGQLLIDGSALEAAQVPRYLRRLAAEEVYAGKEFRMFHLSRPDNEPWHVDFSVSTMVKTGSESRN